MEAYSTFDIARLFGIDRTRLHEWLIRGYVRPAQLAKGKGTKAVFSREDLYRLKLFVRLLDSFKNRSIARDLSDVDFRHVGPERHQFKYGRWVFSFTDGAMSGKGELLKEEPAGGRLRGAQLMVAVDLVSVKTEVDRLLEGPPQTAG